MYANRNVREEKKSFVFPICKSQCLIACRSGFPVIPYTQYYNPLTPANNPTFKISLSHPHGWNTHRAVPYTPLLQLHGSLSLPLKWAHICDWLDDSHIVIVLFIWRGPPEVPAIWYHNKVESSEIYVTLLNDESNVLFYECLHTVLYTRGIFPYLLSSVKDNI